MPFNMRGDTFKEAREIQRYAQDNNGNDRDDNSSHVKLPITAPARLDQTKLWARMKPKRPRRVQGNPPSSPPVGAVPPSSEAAVLSC